MENINKIIAFLSDGDFHSGAELGSQLCISRTAVWKLMRQIEALGLPLESRHGLGYRLAQRIELLDKQRLQANLSATSQRRLEQLTVLSCVNSTNQFLQDHPSRCGVCLTERQTQGCGRHNKTWLTPFASQIALSLSWECSHLSHLLAGLSLAIAPPIVTCLQRYGVTQAGLKWPNDIMIGQAKLAGFLLEIQGEANGQSQLIIGLGINTDLSIYPRHQLTSINQPWTDLRSLTGHMTARNSLASELINTLIATLISIEEQGLTQGLAAWRALDICYQQLISVRQGNKTIIGTAKGISNQGGLLIETANGRCSEYFSGEVNTVRFLETINSQNTSLLRP